MTMLTKYFNVRNYFDEKSAYSATILKFWYTDDYCGYPLHNQRLKWPLTHLQLL